MFIGAVADYGVLLTKYTHICDYQLHFTVPNALPITNGEKTILMKEPSALSENATVLLFLPPM